MFGNRIRELRHEKGLSLRELASEINISFTTLGNYEREDRQPDFTTLEKLANYFGVMVDYLLGRTDARTFDDYVYLNDVHNLGEVIKQSPKEIRGIAVKIIDNTFLTIYGDIIENNVELLQIFQKIYRQIYKMKINLDKTTYNENISINEAIQIFSNNKNQINMLLDDLFQYYLEQNKNTTK